jgi:hypothetical protein
LGIADFTHADLPVTIDGVRLVRKLFHYRLVASVRAYAQVTYAGEEGIPEKQALKSGVKKASPYGLAFFYF